MVLKFLDRCFKLKYLLAAVIGLLCAAASLISYNEISEAGRDEYYLGAKSTEDLASVVVTERVSVANVDLVSEQYKPEIKAEEPIYDQLHSEIVSEINAGVFTHIVEFHSILSYCDGVPRSSNDRKTWIDNNADSSESDINVLDKEMEHCRDVPTLSFNEKEQLYRTALDMGVEQAKLALAKLIPYDSKEKIELLSRSAVWSEEAAMIIAELAIKNNVYMTSQERVFWMVVSDIKSTYADIYEQTISEQMLSLDENEKLQTEKIISLWRSRNAEQMTTAINLLRQIQS